MPTSALALIAAPPDSLRYSLHALLARLPQIDAVEGVEDTRSLLVIVTDQQPKLIMLDVELLAGEARSMLRLIKAAAPHAHCVALVDTIEQQQALQGALVDLVLLKGYPAGELFNRIERLLAQDDETTMFVDSGG
jgi:DNA-binding NarL/FixJ family response regulator